MSITGDYGNIDYLLWRKAYLPDADIKPAGLNVSSGKSVPDGKVERDEWKAYYARTGQLEQDLFSVYHLGVVNGTFLSADLQSDEAFYGDYKNFSAFMRQSVANAAEPGSANHNVFRGVSPQDITDDPNDLLELAKVHSSYALNYWLAESCKCSDTSPEYRKKVADYFLSEFERLSKPGDGNYNHVVKPFLEFVRSETVLREQGPRLLREIPEIVGAYANRMPAIMTEPYLYLLSRVDISSSDRMALFDKFLKEFPSRYREIPEGGEYCIKEFWGGVSSSLATLMRSDKLTEEEIIYFCGKVPGILGAFVDPSRAYSEGAAISFAYAYLNQNVSDKGSEQILKAFNESIAYLTSGGKKYYHVGKEAAFAAVIMATANFRPLSSPPRRREFLLNVLDRMVAMPQGIHHDVPRDIFGSLALLIPRAELTSLVAETVNRAMSGPLPAFEENAQRYGVLINELHDWDAEYDEEQRKLLAWQKSNNKISPEEYSRSIASLETGRDLYRTEIVNKLSRESNILLMSFAGADLYTSTFLRMYESLAINASSIKKLISELDSLEKKFPERPVTANFILTLASFGKLSEVFVLDPNYFVGNIQKLLQSPDQKQIVENTFLLTAVITDLLADPRFSANKAAVEDLLINLYKQDPYSPVSYLIKVNQGNFSEARRVEVDAICASLPEALLPMVPSSWIRDGQIKAKLFFYQEEHYRLIQSMYRSKGFSSRSVDETTVELAKTINGVKVVVDVTMDVGMENLQKALDTDEYQIVGHRGHSYQLGQTFRDYFENTAKGKLLYIGSCGGFRSVPDLMKTYSGNYFISTEVTGRGETNNNVLFYLLEYIANNKDAVAAGNLSFESSYNYVAGKMPRFEEAEIVFPHDKSLLLYDYLSRLPRRPEPEEEPAPQPGDASGTTTGMNNEGPGLRRRLHTLAERIVNTISLIGRQMFRI